VRIEGDKWFYPWLDLPPQLREHLFDHAKERKITRDDLFALEEWRRHSPDVPDGPWYKGFRIVQVLRQRPVSEDIPLAGSARARQGNRVELRFFRKT